MEFTLIRLNDEMRQLITSVAPKHTTRVSLDPLDKGLSGAHVWLAKWSMEGALETPYTVIKINQKKKIRREVEAYENIVRDLDHDIGAFSWTMPEGSDETLAILKQPFRGDAQLLEVVSLRDLVASGISVDRGIKLIDEIYLGRMKNWHPVNHIGREIVEQSIDDAMDWWMSRYALVQNIEEMCRIGISDELNSRFGFGVTRLEELVQQNISAVFKMVVGPVHGDLHSQNIIYEPFNNKIHLIDFGWTAKKWKAVDFFMLECSLKFLAAPLTAKVTNLLAMEESLDQLSGASTSLNSFDRLIFGERINLIAAMILRIRQLCVEEFNYVASFDEYRRGLIALTAALSGYPALNRRFLVNSLAFHCDKLQNA